MQMMHRVCMHVTVNIRWSLCLQHEPNWTEKFISWTVEGFYIRKSLYISPQIESSVNRHNKSIFTMCWYTNVIYNITYNAWSIPLLANHVMMPLRISPVEISELALFFPVEGNCERSTTEEVTVYFANLRQDPAELCRNVAWRSLSWQKGIYWYN